MKFDIGTLTIEQLTDELLESEPGVIDWDPWTCEDSFRDKKNYILDKDGEVIFRVGSTKSYNDGRFIWLSEILKLTEINETNEEAIARAGEKAEYLLIDTPLPFGVKNYKLYQIDKNKNGNSKNQQTKKRELIKGKWYLVVPIIISGENLIGEKNQFDSEIKIELPTINEKEAEKHAQVFIEKIRIAIEEINWEYLRRYCDSIEDENGITFGDPSLRFFKTIDCRLPPLIGRP